MARANRHPIPCYVWHITHRCHKREFLLKFDKDKKVWRKWLFDARKRYGLCILNYTITSNHIHLLVFDQKEGAIPKSVQLIAGRTGREYNVKSVVPCAGLPLLMKDAICGLRSHHFLILGMCQEFQRNFCQLAISSMVCGLWI